VTALSFSRVNPRVVSASSRGLIRAGVPESDPLAVVLTPSFTAVVLPVSLAAVLPAVVAFLAASPLCLPPYPLPALPSCVPAIDQGLGIFELGGGLFGQLGHIFQFLSLFDLLGPEFALESLPTTIGFHLGS